MNIAIVLFFFANALLAKADEYDYDYDYDYWGNEVPSRTKLANGSPGSLSLAKDFWSNEDEYNSYFDFQTQLYNE